MTDIDQTYKRLTAALTNTRDTLADACYDLQISLDDVDDEILEQYCQECSNCGIWGIDHRIDDDGFPVCKICSSITLC